MSYFLALYDIGAAEIVKHTVPEAVFCSFPMDVKAKNPQKVIRIILDASDVHKPQIRLSGLHAVDVTDYMPDEGRTFLEEQDRIRVWRGKYLYREIKGGGSPVSLGKRLGNSVVDMEKRKDKLFPRGEGEKSHGPIPTLFDYFKGAEEQGFFAPGSTETLIGLKDLLVTQVAEMWSSRSSNYFLTVCFREASCGQILYPGETPAVLKYFMEQINAELIDVDELPCMLCGKKIKKSALLSSIFPFATFTKKNFLPGLPASSSYAQKKAFAKSFPLCLDCFGKLSLGNSVAESSLSIFGLWANMTLTLVPEVIGAPTGELLPHVLATLSSQSRTSRAFNIREGLSRMVADRGGRLNYHVLLSEQNRGEQRIHLLAENIRFSLFRRIEEFWERMCSVFDVRRWQRFPAPTIIERVGLTILRCDVLAEEDQLRQAKAKRLLSKISRALLMGSWEDLDTESLKRLFVDRFGAILRNKPMNWETAAKYVNEAVMTVFFLEYVRTGRDVVPERFMAVTQGDPVRAFALFSGMILGWLSGRDNDGPALSSIIQKHIRIGRLPIRLIYDFLKILPAISQKRWDGRIRARWQEAYRQAVLLMEHGREILGIEEIFLFVYGFLCPDPFFITTSVASMDAFSVPPKDSTGIKRDAGACTLRKPEEATYVEAVAQSTD